MLKVGPNYYNDFRCNNNLQSERQKFPRLVTAYFSVDISMSDRWSLIIWVNRCILTAVGGWAIFENTIILWQSFIKMIQMFNVNLGIDMRHNLAQIEDT